MLIRAMIACAFLGVAGCHEVDVPIKNVDAGSLDVRVVEMDSHGVVQQTKSAGTLEVNKLTTVTLKVHNGNDVQVQADLPQQGVECFTGGRSTVTSNDPNPLNLSEVDVSVQAQRLPSSEEAINQLAAAASDMGDIFDNLHATDVDAAAKKYWGALLVMTPTVNDPQTHKITQHQHILFEVDAATINSVQSLDANHAGMDRSGHAKMSGSTALDFSGQFPAFGGISLNGSQSDVYELTWELKGAGWQVRNDPGGFSVADKLPSLPTNMKKQIYDLLSSNKDAMLMYVSDIYVTKGASRTVTKGTTVKAGDKLNAGSIVTVNGAYNFDSSSADTTEVQGLLLNLGGVPFRPAAVVADTFTVKSLDQINFDQFANNKAILVPFKVSIPKVNSGNLVAPKILGQEDYKAIFDIAKQQKSSPDHWEIQN